jgi:thiosulfate dehydrogenase (quinone) large subunit
LYTFPFENEHHLEKSVFMLFYRIVLYLEEFDLERLIEVLCFHSFKNTNQSYLYTNDEQHLLATLGPKYPTMNSTTFLLLRFAVGASMFGHGLVRLPKLAGFSHWMTSSFEKSMLSQALVLPFSYALPILEFIIGLLLLTGLFTRAALIAGALVMILLIFGTTLIENWDAITSQLIHAAFFAVLLQFVRHNSFAVDNLLKR